MTRRGSLKLVAHRGDAKTLLAFDIEREADRAGLAGFSVHVKPPGRQGYYLWNKLTFQDPGAHAQVEGEPPQSSVNAPLHRFRWVHVPGTVHQGTEPAFGEYLYTVTPRYFAGERLQEIDPSLSREVRVEVRPFRKGALRIGFTRGFVQSQAFARRFGMAARFRPDGEELLFDTGAVAGRAPNGRDFTWDEMYEWCGFTARDMVFEVLDEVGRGGGDLKLDVFAYDLSEPDFARALLDLAPSGRVRVILDSADLHHDKADPTPEDRFEREFRSRAGHHAANVKRGRFGRYAHDKVLLVRRGDDPQAVLTGSTNFSVTGLYVNSNHVLRFDDRGVAEAYAEVFDLAWQTEVREAAFARSDLAEEDADFSGLVPAATISFSPHSEGRATAVLKRVTDRIGAEERSGGPRSVLFAMMELGSKAQNPVYERLSAMHASQDMFTMGVSDNPRGIYLYEPGKPDGFLVSGRPGATVLPPPFGQVHGLGRGHQIHHKFVVAGFNGDDPTVFCGSSNLALGGEQHNGDNLLVIRDADVATAFAIEAMGLVDLFQFLDRMGERSDARRGHPPVDATPEKVGWHLGTTDAWARPYWDPNDVRCRDRSLFAR